jgi:hypothetical protein
VSPKLKRAAVSKPNEKWGSINSPVEFCILALLVFGVEEQAGALPDAGE